jgi:hypothetical protein
LRGLALLADVHAGKMLVIEPMALNTGRKCDGKKAWVEKVTAQFRIFQSDPVCADSTRKASKAQRDYPLRNMATSAAEWSHNSPATHLPSHHCHHWQSWRIADGSERARCEATREQRATIVDSEPILGSLDVKAGTVGLLICNTWNRSFLKPRSGCSQAAVKGSTRLNGFIKRLMMMWRCDGQPGQEAKALTVTDFQLHCTKILRPE